MLSAIVMSAALSAIPGTPEAAVPFTEHDAWVVWTNDWFGVPAGEEKDNNRTNSFSGSYLSDSFAWSLDWSMLTDIEKEDGFRTRYGSRLDEMTFTVGLYERKRNMFYSYGIGARIRGNLAGDDVQNWWHTDASKGSKVDAEYETDEYGAVAYGMITHRVFKGEPINIFADDDRSPISGYVTLSAMVGMDADVSGDASFRIQIMSEQFDSMFFGLRYQYRETNGSPVLEKVAEFEDGMWYEYGFFVAHFLSITMRNATDGRGAVGAVNVLMDF